MDALGIKRVLGRANPDYAGMQQHDAHEVTMLLLDKLHEDLNRVMKKPYVEMPEGDGSNDEAVFKESWEKHLLRENSFVLDLIGGAVRNEINCRTCRKTVVKFDSQHAVQLAIPKNNMRTVYVVFIPTLLNYKQDPKRILSSGKDSANVMEDDPSDGICRLLSVSVDKHSTIRQVKAALVATYPTLFQNIYDDSLSKENQQESKRKLDFVEENNDSSSESNIIENLTTFVNDKQTNLFSQFVSGTESIKTHIPMDGYLSLFYTSDKIKREMNQRSYIVLMQVRYR